MKMAIDAGKFEYEVQRDRTDKHMICRSKHTCNEHFHKQLEIAYCNFGKQHAAVNGKSYILSKGDVLIVSPYAIHAFGQSAAWCTIACIPTVYYQYYSNLSNLSDDMRLIKAKQGTLPILKAMRKLKNMENRNHLVKLSLVLGILGEILDKGEFEKSYDTADSNLVNTITNYIDENYTKKIDLASLSAHCNYSKAYLSKFFNNHFNCSFNDFVNIIRLNAFIELQLEKGGNFSENAFAVGFQTSRTFYNVFKERYQTTPTEYFAKK